ncbi:MAG TPA: DNA polymerase III subunit gamma/tau, partial [Opitutaceae bacterium]|nr:DNA polymerase III subunit gamma/tau [Opitutaceae bacterium]
KVPYFPPEKHPDFITVRPSGKMRQIRVEDFEPFLDQIQLSPQLSRRKVAVVFDADRLNIATANKFLKTLEEPPAGTTILLVTTRPNDLLPTIRSRCQRFQFKVGAAALTHPALPAWLSDYRDWLGRLTEGMADKRAISDSIFAAYGLVARFNGLLEALTAEAWTAQKASLPEELDDDEIEAIEVGLANGLRLRLFTELEASTLAFARDRLTSGDASTRRALIASISKLEQRVRLLRLNLNESVVLEDFLLSSLRIWTKK